MLGRLVDSGALPLSRLDTAGAHVLETMFRFGLVEHPPPLRPGAEVDRPSHAAFAEHAAEESMVLLRNQGGLLPLVPHPRSIALIGAGAGPAATTAGEGSAHVTAPFASTPRGAIRARVGRATRVDDVGGPLPGVPLPAIAGPAVVSSDADLVATTALGRPAPTPSAATGGDRARPAPARPGGRRSAPRLSRAERAARTVLEGLVRDGATGVGSIPPRDFADLDRLRLVVDPPTSGWYAISLTDRGDAWLDLDGHLLLADGGQHVGWTWQVAAKLRAGHRYRVTLFWFPLVGASPPRLGWQDETPSIERAVAAARAASVAVVLAEAPSSEGADRPDLSLPGTQDALIAAVAAVNPRTVVVLDTPGAVLMPWLSRVGAVLEAWYPGEEDGAATAAVLFGASDPSGRLPVTFPASGDGVPTGALSAWPGVDGTVEFAGGLQIGYRYDAAHGVRPLFPFGFGLSYTSFGLSGLSLSRSPGGVTATVRVENTGGRSGSEVVQAYLSFPAAAGEPPIVLAAFGRVELAPGASADVALDVPTSAFEAFIGGRFRPVAGDYTLHVGTSSMDLPLAVRLVAP